MNKKVKGLTANTVSVADDNGNNLEFSIGPLDKLEYSLAYRLIIKSAQNVDKLIIRMKNYDTLIEEHKQSTLSEVISLGIVDVDHKRHIFDGSVIVQIREDACLYHAEEANNSRTKDHKIILEDQRKTIEELLELEPDNRFAHSQLIFLIESIIEPCSNTPDLLKQRAELLRIIVKSSENLLEKNPKNFHRFSYFLKLYKFK